MSSGLFLNNVYYKPEEFVFVKKPTICFNCWRYGHIQKNCTNDAKCVKCSMPAHDDANCKNVSKCINCGEAHPSNEIKCKIYQTHLKKLNNPTD